MTHATAIPSAHEPLFQVFVTENHPVHGRREIAVGPKMARRYLEPLMERIGRDIASGKERAARQPWSNPRLLQVTAPRFETDGLFTREERANPLIGSYGL